MATSYAKARTEIEQLTKERDEMERRAKWSEHVAGSALAEVERLRMALECVKFKAGHALLEGKSICGCLNHKHGELATALEADGGVRCTCCAGRRR